ncbi:hypothetical protein EV421DRAFT_1912144 [Armillaria borealis]|uniref:Alpha-ketoglutarate-dependent dioxygenase AlkB-like domain-containing protein n=1 Tax=Armillaria borealis TaxID=47425 RepID=A0AA39IVA0_9AGAR|nr:hypothetical protein EV421DRAFT_1912144 [Armillaria borealis]
MPPKLWWLPPLWSTSHQGLCKGSQVMKSYHSGVYMLILRDTFLFHGEIIISYVGSDAQYQDHQPSLLSAYDAKSPIVVYISDDYPLFPYVLPKPIAYCQLGKYMVTDEWDEIANNAIYCKAMFKFVYTEEQSTMWWRPEHVFYDVPVLYDIGPICLHQGCCVFWTVGVDAELALNNNFLLSVLVTRFTCNDQQIGLVWFINTSHRGRGIMYTNYFSHNSGEPYKYIGGGANTTEWNQESQGLKMAKRFILQTLKQILFNVPDFNELLRPDSVAYLPNQSMTFHSDDKQGVQGFIAGLLLGSDAAMDFCSKGDIRDCPTLLTIRLSHGDILAMDGDDIQKKYLHRVKPFRYCFAVTARFIAK